MNKDMCVLCGEGIINIPVGAIILKDNYYYSVGGRIKHGETDI